MTLPKTSLSPIRTSYLLGIKRLIFCLESNLEGISNFKFNYKILVGALGNPTIQLESSFHLCINFKILLQIVFYSGFCQIVKFKSTLGPLGINPLHPRQPHNGH